MRLDLRWVLTLCLLLAARGSAAGEPAGNEAREPAPPPPSGPAAKTAFFLIVDYLPLALYEGEPLTACLRVENATNQKTEVELRGELLDAAGQVLRAEVRTLSAPPAGFVSCQIDQDPGDARRVRFVLKTPQGDVPGPALRLVRDEDGWPETTPGGRRLFVAHSDEALLPVVRKYSKAEERRWAALAWALGKRDKVEAGASGFVFVPGAWGAARAGAAPDVSDLLPQKTVDSRTWGVLGPYAIGGAPPLLRAIGAMLEVLPRPPPDRVVLALPPEDQEAATDPRAYRMLLDTLLARLRREGVREVVIFPPFQFGIPEAAQKLLWTQVQEATATQQARYVDPTEFLDERTWRADPAVKGVYGPRPNAEGRKKLAQKLAGLLP